MNPDMLKRIIYRIIIACLALTALLGLLAETGSMNTSWTLIFLPLFISLGLLIPYTHMYISETCASLKSNSLSLILILFYFFELSLFVFILVLGLKADEYLNSSWYSIFIPLWFSIFTASFFTTFMMPGLLDPLVKLYREAWTLLSVNIAVIVSSIMLASYLEEDLDYLWVAALPLLLTLSVCLGFLLFYEYQKNEILWAVTETEFILYIGAIGTMIIAIVNDANGSVPNYSFFVWLLVCACSHILAFELRNEFKKEAQGPETERLREVEENDLD